MNPNALLRLSVILNNSQLLNVITYPFQELYLNIKNILTKNYPARSSIRIIIAISGFIVGPILTQVVHWSWFTDLAFYLYNSVPIFNLLPSQVGTAICSSYIGGYFCSWFAKQATNLFNAAKEQDLKQYINGSVEHYLDPTKAQEITALMLAAGFNITVYQISEIFNKIRSLASLDPTNRILITMLGAIRQGDLQTILDKATLLEHEIQLINDKINTLSVFGSGITPAANFTELLPNSPIDMAPTREAAFNIPAARPEAIMFQYNTKAQAWKKHNRALDNMTPETTIANLNNHRQELEKSRFISQRLINTIQI